MVKIQLPGGYHLAHDRFGGVWLLRKDNKPIAYWRRAPKGDKETTRWLSVLYRSVVADSIGRFYEGERFLP